MLSEINSRQVLALAAQGLNAPAISAELGLAEELVRVTLLGNNAGAAPDDRDISDSQLAAIRQRLADIAMNSDDENNAAKVGMFLLERDKPRKVATPEASTSLALVNTIIVQAQDKMKALMQSYQNPGPGQKVIESNGHP